MNTATTSTDRPTLTHTSVIVSVRIDVEPNNTIQMSPARLGPVENTFKIR
jgi:hypothetical protein